MAASAKPKAGVTPHETSHQAGEHRQSNQRRWRQGGRNPIRSQNYSRIAMKMAPVTSKADQRGKRLRLTLALPMHDPSREIGNASVADETDQADQDDAGKNIGGTEEAARVEDNKAKPAIAAEKFGGH